KLDLVLTGQSEAAVYLGKGDGTFGDANFITSGELLGSPAIGDFNGDGKLDLAVPDGASVHVLLGNGDGTFQAGVTYQTAYGGFSAAAADVNGDGKLDIVTNGVSVLLGNGDGTFTSDGGVNLDTGDYFASGVNIADFNGDGKLDVAVGDPIYLLLGNGDGTFQNATPVASDDNLISLGMGDFNGDGKIDLIGHSVYLQIPINLYPSHLDFKDEKIGIKSPPKTVTVTNDSSSALTISNIGITGFDPKDFAETNDCPASLPIGANCKIKATFQPRAKGLRDATLDVTYEGFGSRKGVGLSGYGEVSTVKLAPPQLEFPTQPVGTDSSPQKATLTNTGDVTVNISNISATGAFTEKNNCPAALAAGANCQIEVEFAPQQKGAAAGKLSVKDDAEGSPQTVALSGTGTVVKLSSGGVNFGDQKVGTKSQPAPVQLTNVGTVSLTIDQIVIKGADPGDFSQTNNCGKSVPAGGSCTIKVIFDPQATGSRSASLEINDNGGGSPQKVSLSGTGT
ncbi:MAG: choice-of-anchor D domain-containing protein, partial [Terriglobales bacterium]